MNILNSNIIVRIYVRLIGRDGWQRRSRWQWRSRRVRNVGNETHANSYVRITHSRHLLRLSNMIKCIFYFYLVNLLHSSVFVNRQKPQWNNNYIMNREFATAQIVNVKRKLIVELNIFRQIWVIILFSKTWLYFLFIV